MEDFNQKATKEIADMIHYVAEEAVGNAGYDKTRSGRVTKVYHEGDLSENPIIGYDVVLSGKEYHFDVEKGRSIIAKENNIVNVTMPCNNMNFAFLSYPRDPSDFLNNLDTIDGGYNYGESYNSGRFTKYVKEQKTITFPSSTFQFSTISVPLYGVNLKTATSPWGFIVTATNGVLATVESSNVISNPNPYLTPIMIKLYNENGGAFPVTKTTEIQLVAYGEIAQ